MSLFFQNETGEQESMIIEKRKQTSQRKKRKPCFLYFGIFLLLALAIGFMAFGLTQGFFVLFGIFQSSTDTVITTTTPCPEASTSSKTCPPVHPTVSCERRMVGYFNVHFLEDLTEKQLSLLTHIIFFPISFESNGTLTFRDTKAKDNFKKFSKMAKSVGVKTTFSSHGESSKNFPTLCANSEKRKVLVSSIISLILEHQLDGFDINWQWPKTEADFSNLIILCNELRETFNQLSHSNRALIISQLVPRNPTQMVLQRKLSMQLDFLNVDVTGFYGMQANRIDLVGASSPLYSGHPETPNENVDNTMGQYSCQIGNPNKLNMMLSPDGRTWNNVILPKNASDTLWMKSEKIAGTSPGGWLYWKILRYWDLSNALWNDESKTPYAWYPEKRKYLTFENERSILEKVKYANRNNFGGITFWEMNTDSDDATVLEILSTVKTCPDRYNNIVNYNCD